MNIGSITCLLSWLNLIPARWIFPWNISHLWLDESLILAHIDKDIILDLNQCLRRNHNSRYENVICLGLRQKLKWSDWPDPIIAVTYMVGGEAVKKFFVLIPVPRKFCHSPWLLTAFPCFHRSITLKSSGKTERQESWSAFLRIKCNDIKSSSHVAHIFLKRILS